MNLYYLFSCINHVNMRAPCFISIFIILFLCKATNETQSQTLPEKMVVDNYYGQKIEDPYRYMENPYDSSLIKWYQQQEILAKNTLHSIPNRQRIKILHEELYKRDSISISQIRITNNDFYFYLKRDRRKKKGKLLYYRNGLRGKEIFLFDPSSFKADTGKKYSINYIKPSWDGAKVVVSLVEKNGVEISEMIIINVITKKVYPQVINHCWPREVGGVEWLPDNTGFAYTRFPEINKNSKNYILHSVVVLHKLGEKNDKLNIILSKEKNPELSIKDEDILQIQFPLETGKYMFGSLSGASYYADFYYATIANLVERKVNWKPLFKKGDLVLKFDVIGDDIVYLTAKNASNFKICKTSLIKPNFESPKTLIFEDSAAAITDFTITKDGLYYTKIKNGVDAKLYHYKEEESQNIPVPRQSGDIGLISKGAKHNELWVDIRGWTFSRLHYRYNHDTKKFVEEYLFPTAKFKIDDVVIKEVEVLSHDDVKVPLSIIYKKGTKLNKEARVLITGYGTFGISKTPKLGNYIYHWVNAGGVYAVAHVRGGGEKGNAWHLGGYKTTKPNSWKDFIACTEYMIDQNYTTPDKIVITGKSAGGIIIGRAITERPDLYAAAVINSGVLHALRREFGSNGKSTSKEYGTVKDSVEFKALLAMDAYRHINKGEQYPALYITAGINDSRVPIWQSSKFVAKMQAFNASNKPVLFSVDFEGGHRGSSNKEKSIEKITNFMSFALWQTGHPDYQIK